MSSGLSMLQEEHVTANVNGREDRERPTKDGESEDLLHRCLPALFRTTPEALHPMTVGLNLARDEVQTDQIR